MRLINLYVVLDTAAGTLVGQIYREHSPVPVLRGLTEAANDGKSLIAQNPADFDMLHIGMIDEETGRLFSPHGELLVAPQDDQTGAPNTPTTIANALALVRKDQ